MQEFNYIKDYKNTREILSALECVHPNLCASDILFLDIETTGFSPKNSACFLVGLGSVSDGSTSEPYTSCRQLFADTPDDESISKSSISCRQLFADTPDDEAELLRSLMEYIHVSTVLVTYNGASFDVPFIIERCKRLGIGTDLLKECAHIDIYTYMKKLNSLIHLDNLKQKSIEKFCGINRDDIYSGGELIEVYREYIIQYKLHEDTSALLNRILLHNREDVENLAIISKVLTYTELAVINNSRKLRFKDMSIMSGCNVTPISTYIASHPDTIANAGLTVTQILSFSFTADFSFPAGLSINVCGIIVTVSGNEVTFAVPIICGILKHFYKDYKNYFYLPDEDTAIHKSVAAYVDSSRRVKASKDNCYSKKEGQFIPFFDETKYPCLKMNYNDDSFFIQYDKEMCRDENFLRKYAADIIHSHQH